MNIRNQAGRFGAIAALAVAAALAGVPASAQVDLSGTWTPQYQEDQPERIPGPDLVDYLGIPINAEARQWALSWDPDRLTLQEHQCQVHTAAYIYRGPLQLRIWEERDPQTQDLIAIHNYTSTYEQNRTIWMDNRPHPPDYSGALLLDGILDRALGWQRPDRHHHAHQAGLASPQRDSFQRHDHLDGALHPARQSSDACKRCERPHLPGGTADQERGLRFEPEFQWKLAVALRICG